MPPFRSLSRVAFVVGAAVMSGGCYSYVPVQNPAPGTMVRIEVPVRSTVAGGPVKEETASMEGRVVSAGDSIRLEMETKRQLGNFREIKSVDTLRVATNQLTEVDARVFSRPKTFLLGAVIAAGTITLAVAAFKGLTGSGGGGPPGGGSTGSSIRVIPIFTSLLHALGR